MGAPELPELLVVVSQEGKKKLLVEIFNEIGTRLGVMEVKRLLDCMINEVGILKDKGISGGFVTSQAPGDECLFLLGHNPIA
jgi:hypothetical protein